MKKKVALLANGWNGENLDNFISGFNEKFADEELDLFVFTSYSLLSQDIFVREADDSIYSLPDFSFFDAVIVFCSGINSDEIVDEVLEKCKKVDVPVILQGSDIEGISSVTVDNYVGMRDLCDHLIEQHNVKDVVYIAGLKDNEDSNFRMKVLEDSLNAHGYKLEEDNIFYANWEPNEIYTYITETYGEGKKKLPDAFVCANDQMAIFVLVFLEQIGFLLPDEVAVTGFDNLRAGRVYYPSLTTVDQSYREQGSASADIVMELFNDAKIVKKSSIPCVACIGESCCCVNRKNETELRRQVGRDVWSNQYLVDNMRGRQSQLDMCIMSKSDFEEVQDIINNDFFATTNIETEDFHIYVNSEYKDLAYMYRTATRSKNSFYSPIMDVIAARTDGVICTEHMMNSRDLLLGYSGEGKGKTYIFRALIVDDYAAGYMVMGYLPGTFESRKYSEFAGNLNKTLIKFQKNIDDRNRSIRIQEQANIFLRQTVEALATAVDAKDSYTHGHSARVARYARKIAEISGMSEEECDDIYLTGLLHDIGKIGIKDEIINKEGTLNAKEFNAIKQHTILGDEILSNIQMSPFLSVGARHHHERYDGRGYPDQLKGDDIPKIARIIAVADAYDAMTSKRSYRALLPQMFVREELVKGTGTQFDPDYAKIMLHLLDKDEEYKMKENRKEEVFSADTSYVFDAYGTSTSTGLRITDCPVSIKLQYEAFKDEGMPTLIFYDSSDSKYYKEGDKLSEDMDYIEFVRVGMDGDVSTNYVRKMKLNTSSQKEINRETNNRIYNADIKIVKQDDHLLVNVDTDEKINEYIFALNDASRFLYLAFTGAYCRLDIQDVHVDENPVGANYIPRIADKISYIDRPEGDIPNVQIDGWRTDNSEVIDISNKVNLSFQAMSLPSARRVWHCPIICIFTSDDGSIKGPNYKELALARLDGEVWCEYDDIINNTTTSMGERFENWSVWKQRNKAGVNCKVSMSYKRDTIYLETENSGLRIINQTKLPDRVEKVYCFLTGDQCAITDIRID